MSAPKFLPTEVKDLKARLCLTDDQVDALQVGLALAGALMARRAPIKNVLGALESLAKPSRQWHWVWKRVARPNGQLWALEVAARLHDAGDPPTKGKPYSLSAARRILRKLRAEFRKHGQRRRKASAPAIARLDRALLSGLIASYVDEGRNRTDLAVPAYRYTDGLPVCVSAREDKSRYSEIMRICFKAIERAASLKRSGTPEVKGQPKRHILAFRHAKTEQVRKQRAALGLVKVDDAWAVVDASADPLAKHP